MFTAINLDGQFKIVTILWLGVIGVVFIGVWGYYFKEYPLVYLSYVQILKSNPQKFSIPKLFYPLIFIFLIIWGSIISKTPAIVPYISLIILSIIWIFFTNFKGGYLYNLPVHRIRATINQGLTIFISIAYIIL